MIIHDGQCRESSNAQMHVSFEKWAGQRELVSDGTNAGAKVLPFQTWHHFKEAFAPELVA